MERKGKGQAPRKRIFYGWYVVGGVALVSMVSAGMTGVGFGLFVKPIEEELGIPQAYFGWALSARLLGFAITASFIGRLLDRYGARWMLVVAGLAMGVLVFSLGLITEGWHLVALFALIGMIGMQGAGGNLYGTVPVSRWFRRRRGRAMSVAFLGIPAGIFLSPLIPLLIGAVGWRWAIGFIGIFGAVVIVLAASLIIRRAPEDMGLLPDGDTPDTSLGDVVRDQAVVDEYSWTRAQAVRSGTFWRLVLVYGLLFGAISTIGLYRTPFYQDQGIAPGTIALAFSAEAIVSVLVAIPAGWALDRFNPHNVAPIPIVMMIGAFLMTMNTTTEWHVFASTMMFGAAAASMSVVQAAIWPAYFGSLHIGAIRGVAMQVMMAFSLIGAPAAGMVKDATGSYFPAWWVAIGGLAISATVMYFTPRAKPPSEALVGSGAQPDSVT